MRLVPLISRSTGDIISKVDGKDKIIKVLKYRTKFVGFLGCGVFYSFFFKQNKLGSKSSCR